MKAPYVDFKELKAAVSIRRVLERYDLIPTLREQGDRLSGPCPICKGESTTAFRVSQEKNCFKCFGCQAGGNMLDFVAAMEDRSIREASVLVAEWFGIETGRASRRRPPEKGRPPESRLRESSFVQESPPDLKASAKPRREALGSRPENAPLTFQLKLDPNHAWFAEVGLSPATVEQFGLGFCSKGVMGGRIAFPLRNAAGELVGYAGRWPGENPSDGQPLWKFPKDLALDLLPYPVDRLIRDRPQVFRMARDPLEVVLLWQRGERNVVAFLGEDVTERTLEVLKEAFG